MPPRRVTRVIRVIKDRHAHGMSVDFTPVIHPLGALTPERLVLVASTVHCLAVGGGHAPPVGEAQVGMCANAHRALLGVAKLHVTLRGMNGYVVRDQHSFLCLKKAYGSLVCADRLSVRPVPVVLGHNRATPPAFGPHHLGRDNLAGLIADMPKTDAVYLAMREPKRGMMHVVSGLALDFFERIITGHAHPMRADDRVKHRLVIALGDVLREQLAVDLNAKLVAVLLDLNRPLLCIQLRLAKCQGSHNKRK